MSSPEPLANDAQAERIADLDAALYLVNKLTQDYEDPARQFANLPLPVYAPSLERCDWEHGICLCPGCGVVVAVLPRAGQAARVVDLDKREHHCSRTIAGTLHQHGVSGMGGQIARHADRPPLDSPRPSAPLPEPPPTNGHYKYTKGKTGL